MKRFVTYIYEYDRGIRGRNVGFIRTDIRENLCRMELHIRGLDRVKGKGKVYFTVYDDIPIGVPAADILLSQGIGNLTLACPKNLLGQSGYTVDDIQAVVIQYGNGKLLAGSFVNEPASEILHGEFTEWSKNSVQVKSKPSDVMTSTPAEPLPADPATSTPAGSQPADPATSVPDNPLSAPAVAATKTEPESSNTAAPAQMKSATIESEAPQASYRKIEITDIRSLPRRNWYLCNNSFLVHGFFNYHYLMLKTVETGNKKQRFLGVPGIYEQPERMMALLFGFPEFEASEESKYSRPQSEKDASGVFGYWMCPLAEE